MTLVTRSGRRASQDEWELRSLIDLFRAEGVRSYLEIGARHGDTFFEIMAALPKGSRGVALDLPGGNWGTPKSANPLVAACNDLIAQGRDVKMILGNSQDPALIARVTKAAPFDSALIDGDHLYEGVRADWLNYGPMSRLVAFHDIAGDGEATRDGRELPVEVPRLWREIRGGYRHVEFIAPGSKMGIGVLWR